MSLIWPCYANFQVISFSGLRLRAPVQEHRIHSPSKNSLISQLARSTVIGQLLTIVTPPFPNPISVARGHQAVATATMAPVASFMRGVTHRDATKSRQDWGRVFRGRKALSLLTYDLLKA